MSNYWDYSENQFNAEILKNFLLKRGDKINITVKHMDHCLDVCSTSRKSISNVLQNEPRDLKVTKQAFLQKNKTYALFF